MADRWVITFESVYFVMKAERVLRQGGMDIRLIPVPRQFSSDCGLAIELSSQALDRVKEILQKNGVKAESFHEWTSK
jgi:hypothetical protein